MDDWKEMKKKNYKTHTVLQWKRGFIDFSPDGMKSVKNGEKLGYEEYLEAQKNACGKCREFLALSYYAGEYISCCGQISRCNPRNQTLLFERLMISDFYSGGAGFQGKEDHIWMPSKGFESFAVNDCVSFHAEVGRYMKTGHGRQIDFELRNPENICKISDYRTPTDEELIDEQIELLLCDTCPYTDHCHQVYCLWNPEEKQERFQFLKNLQPGKFTYLTVIAAFELEYHFIGQLGGYLEFPPDHPCYKPYQKLLCYAALHPGPYRGDPDEALFKIMYPERPRMYINQDDPKMS